VTEAAAKPSIEGSLTFDAHLDLLADERFVVAGTPGWRPQEFQITQITYRRRIGAGIDGEGYGGTGWPLDKGGTGTAELVPEGARVAFREAFDAAVLAAAGYGPAIRGAHGGDEDGDRALGAWAPRGDLRGERRTGVRLDG
jgi:hypothetical protein